MNHRKEQFRKAELKSRYPNSYTDNGKYISKRMKKKMIAITSNPYHKFEMHKKGKVGEEVWRSKFGRKLLK